ncbi:uncharacterized protein LOC26535966 [Drosophila yakuba]|uniref:Uncharacterized protein n=1 Tax=Drosophila yakuba TaxID=7245 RepID=A0A0R1DSU9_DROYA|nr:uncharacterized protein LOC26535966 [Drosophila yakuba]KRJ98051.1 uncharacterized protein Dyak_GE28785 [Drosophila yakuba]
MLYKSLVLCLVTIWFISAHSDAKEYQFIPARCEEQPGVGQQIGGPLSICSFPPNYEKPDSEDIEAVIKHIKSLQLN